MKASVLVFTLAIGCEGVVPGIDWQQMNEQPKPKAFRGSVYFSDGRAMQAPPPGTIARDEVLDRPGFTSGVERGAYLERVPMSITLSLLTEGRTHFETYCAVCHGIDGSGDSEVARNMELRRPPSFISPPITRFPSGRIFEVATEGYGLMPSYASELDPDERWAVVAYLEALVLSRAARVETLPAALRAEAERELGAQR